MLARRALACTIQFVDVRHCGGDCIAVACFQVVHSILSAYIVATLVQFQMVHSVLTTYVYSGVCDIGSIPSGLFHSDHL